MCTWYISSNNSKNGKYLPGNVYNNTQEIFIKIWGSLSMSGLDLSGDIPNFTNHDISESNMRCDICIR